MPTREEMTFQCVQCGITKPISEFHKDTMNRTGHHWDCKVCANESAKKRYTQGDSMRLSRLRYGRTDMARYTRLKSNAKRCGTEFLLDKLEFLVWFQNKEKVCYYCGVSLNTNGNREAQISVDRKDNGVGYTHANIELSCQRCNTIKGNIFTENEMMEIAERYIKPKLPKEKL